MNGDYLYLDNAASSHPKPQEVYEAADRALRMGANPGRSGHRGALNAARSVLETRELAARLFNASDSSRIVFTSNATHALNQAIKGFLRPGDHAVTSSMEHNSVLRPLYAMEAQGSALTIVRADAAGRVDPQAIEDAIKPSTRLVVLNHASNVCGTLLDAAAVGDICRRMGVAFLLDASQTAGSLPIDVRALGVDMLAAAGHKGLLGPQGTGILYVSEGIELSPLLHGGTGFDSESRRMPEAMPERLEGGTLNTPGIAGLGAGIRFILDKGVDTVRASELIMISRALTELASIGQVRLYGPTDPVERVGVVSFNIEGKDGAHVGYALDEVFSIGVRVGLHCAPEAHRTIGTFPAGTVRAGFGPFNTEEDSVRLARAVRRIASI